MPPRSWPSTIVPARCPVLACALLVCLAAGIGCGGGPGGEGAPSTEPAAAGDSASRWLAELESGAGEANRLKVFLFYQSADGDLLLPVEREIFRTEELVDQAKQVIELLARAPEDGEAVSALPPGTRLRSLFLFEDGLAVADFSGEMSRAHPGGVWGEVATIYSVVDSLTFNFPSIRRVKILVDGREAETLAGHVSLAHPFGMDLSMVGAPRSAVAETAPAVPTPEIVSPPGDGGA